MGVLKDSICTVHTYVRARMLYVSSASVHISIYQRFDIIIRSISPHIMLWCTTMCSWWSSVPTIPRYALGMYNNPAFHPWYAVHNGHERTSELAYQVLYALLGARARSSRKNVRHWVTLPISLILANDFRNVFWSPSFLVLLNALSIINSRHIA